MFSEFNLAIRQRSASQTNGGRPFFLRTSFVFSKARRSIALASPKDAGVTLAEAPREAVAEMIRLGLEYAVAVTNRATGLDSTFCAETEWPRPIVIKSRTKPNAWWL